MEIAELVLSCISTVVAVLSFVFAFFAKKESKEIKKELNFIIENNPDINVSVKTKISTKVKGNNNFTAGGNLNVKN